MDPRLPIRSIDYTVIFVRQMRAMREFYGSTLGFPLHRELSARWFEYRVGSNILALRESGSGVLPPIGAPTLEIYAEIEPAKAP